jgi:hypothetical protein
LRDLEKIFCEELSKYETKIHEILTNRFALAHIWVAAASNVAAKKHFAFFALFRKKANLAIDIFRVEFLFFRARIKFHQIGKHRRAVAIF